MPTATCDPRVVPCCGGQQAYVSLQDSISDKSCVRDLVLHFTVHIGLDSAHASVELKTQPWRPLLNGYINCHTSDVKLSYLQATLYSPWTRVICPTKFKNWRTLKSFWGIIYHICGVSLPPIPGHLELGGTQRIDILIKVILHCKMVQIGHFQRVIREVSRGCLMVPIILTCQDMSIFR